MDKELRMLFVFVSVNTLLIPMVFFAATGLGANVFGAFIATSLIAAICAVIAGVVAAPVASTDTATAAVKFGGTTFAATSIAALAAIFTIAFTGDIAIATGIFAVIVFVLSVVFAKVIFGEVASPYHNNPLFCTYEALRGRDVVAPEEPFWTSLAVCLVEAVAISGGIYCFILPRVGWWAVVYPVGGAGIIALFWLVASRPQIMGQT